MNVKRFVFHAADPDAVLRVALARRALKGSTRSRVMRRIESKKLKAATEASLDSPQPANGTESLLPSEAEDPNAVSEPNDVSLMDVNADDVVDVMQGSDEPTEEQLVQKLDDLRAEKKKIFALISLNMQKKKERKNEKEKQRLKKKLEMDLTTGTQAGTQAVIIQADNVSKDSEPQQPEAADSPENTRKKHSSPSSAVPHRLMAPDDSVYPYRPYQHPMHYQQGATGNIYGRRPPDSWGTPTGRDLHPNTSIRGNRSVPGYPPPRPHPRPHYDDDLPPSRAQISSGGPRIRPGYPYRHGRGRPPRQEWGQPSNLPPKDRFGKRNYRNDTT